MSSLLVGSRTTTGELFGGASWPTLYSTTCESDIGQTTWFCARQGRKIITDPLGKRADYVHTTLIDTKHSHVCVALFQGPFKPYPNDGVRNGPQHVTETALNAEREL